MSIAFESSRSSSCSSSDSNLGFDFGRTMWRYNSSDRRRFSAGASLNRFPAVVEEDEEEDCSSSSSSIGKNSDDTGAGGANDHDQDQDGEVQSAPLNSLNALEEALPVKRGISTFYAGKSKSFASLGDAASAPTIQDIVKPEDAYSRKRKNMVAHSVLFDKNHDTVLRSGVSKRFANASRSTLRLGSTMDSCDGDRSGESSGPNSLTSGLSLPPLPVSSGSSPANQSSGLSSKPFSPTGRSLSLPDLEHASATSSITGPGSCTREKEEDD